MTIIPQGGYWFFAAGVAFHATDAGTIDFADDGEAEADGTWITIGGGPGPKGQRHSGGFPAKVSGGTPGPDGKLQGGTIVGGKLAERLGLRGKTTDQVIEHLAAVNEHRRAGKSLTEAVKAAHAEAPPDTKSAGETPRTERAASWWGPEVSRSHWKSGGILASDGRAARAADRPPPGGAPSRATHPLDPHPADDQGGLVRVRDPNAPEARGARSELYVLARQSDHSSGFHLAPPGGYVGSGGLPSDALRRLDAQREPATGEMRRLAAEVYRKIGAGEDVAVVVDAAVRLARATAGAMTGSRVGKNPLVVGTATYTPDQAEREIRFAAGMAADVLKKYNLTRLPRDPWLDDRDHKAGGPAPADSTWQGFVSGLKGFEHSGHQHGAGWIARHNGELVSSKAAPNGTTVETYRVRFPDRDLLLTWGRAPAQDQRSGSLPPSWSVVHDKANKAKGVAPVGDGLAA